ncbi:DUF58 domain-containing protein [Halogeometricum borinquense]|uniref:DUF58 domain-containing protein n=1 Tax=Halogeometricum borinquense TaxID=60847 RepID=UPI0034212037
MRPTNRFWSAVGTGGLLCVLAGIFADPLLLGAAALIAGTVLVGQYRFTNELLTVSSAMSVEQHLSRTHVLTDEPVLLTLRVNLPVETLLDVTISPSLPLVATSVSPDERTVSVADGQLTRQSYQLTVPTAGIARFSPPEVTVTGPAGCFEETFSVAVEETLTVEPRAPRRIHVGQGGNRVSTSFGEHESGQRGSGLEPAEIRRYVYGDDISRIDWKATARLNHPHIRDYEMPTARQTALIVDHRASTADGTPGETKLDFLREIALAFVNSADSLDDPIGLYTVGDEGTTNTAPPRASERQYRSIRSTLRNLEPTTGKSGAADAKPGQAAISRRTATTLSEDNTAFGETLRPYFGATNRYADRFADRPLFSTTQSRLGRLQGAVWSVVLTDDTNRSELYESIKAVRRTEGRVLVFITPSALFDSTLGNIEAAYAEYREFESFRKRLNKLDGVTAFEVAHETRLESIRQSGPSSQRRSEGWG